MESVFMFASVSRTRIHSTMCNKPTMLARQRKHLNCKTCCGLLSEGRHNEEEMKVNTAKAVEVVKEMLRANRDLSDTFEGTLDRSRIQALNQLIRFTQDPTYLAELQGGKVAVYGQTTPTNTRRLWTTVSPEDTEQQNITIGLTLSGKEKDSLIEGTD